MLEELKLSIYKVIGITTAYLFIVIFTADLAALLLAKAIWD